jgi:hypothetical protein
MIPVDGTVPIQIEIQNFIIEKSIKKMIDRFCETYDVLTFVQFDLKILYDLM